MIVCFFVQIPMEKTPVLIIKIRTRRCILGEASGNGINSSTLILMIIFQDQLGYIIKPPPHGLNPDAADIFENFLQYIFKLLPWTDIYLK